jgi:hypothetical protein
LRVIGTLEWNVFELGGVSRVADVLVVGRFGDVLDEIVECELHPLE